MSPQELTRKNNWISGVTLITTIGDLITEIAIIYYVFQVHGLAKSALAVFFLEIGRYLAKIVLPLSQRVKNIRNYVVGTQVIAGLLVLFIFYLVTTNGPLWLIWATYVLQCCFSEQFDALKEVFSKNFADRSKVLGSQHSFQLSNTQGMFAGRLIGTALILLLLYTFGMHPAFIIDAATFFIGAMVFWIKIPNIKNDYDIQNVTRKFQLRSIHKKYLLLRAIVHTIPVTVFNYMIIIFVAENYAQDISHTATSYILIALGSVFFTTQIMPSKIGNKVFGTKSMRAITIAALLMIISRLIFVSGTDQLLLVGIVALILGGGANALIYHYLANIRRGITQDEKDLSSLITIETWMCFAFLVLLVPTCYFLKNNYGQNLDNSTLVVGALVPLLLILGLLRDKNLKAV